VGGKRPGDDGRGGHRAALDEDGAKFFQGPADAFLLTVTADDCVAAVLFARRNDLAFTMLGSGSNVIVGDGGIRGVVCSAAMRNVEICGNTVKAQAGAPLDMVVAATVNAGLSGMEKLSGIPGNAGGAVKMNAGAFGQETGDCFAQLQTHCRQ